MSLTRHQVAKVALLARLQLDDEELDRLTDQLAEIVTYVEQLAELDTDGVEPMAHALDLAGVFRADEVRASFPRDEMLAGCAKHDGECYLVPAVLGE